MCHRKNPLSAASLALAALCLAGCGRSGRAPVYPVTGQVLLDGSGKPAAGATVIFHPAKGATDSAPRAVGQADDQGTFTLTTYEKGDGAAAGDYVVTVEWRAAKKTPLDP